jgi:hypothetical protein
MKALCKEARKRWKSTFGSQFFGIN